VFVTINKFQKPYRSSENILPSSSGGISDRISLIFLSWHSYSTNTGDVGSMRSLIVLELFFLESLRS